MNGIFNIQMRLIKIGQEQMIFTVYEQVQMILRCKHFQDLTRNDLEMTQNDWEWMGNIINECYSSTFYVI